MNPRYRKPTDTDHGECTNFTIDEHGGLTSIFPTKNAVIVQIFADLDKDGNRYIRRSVSIECIDESLYPDLQKEAGLILNKEQP